MASDIPIDNGPVKGASGASRAPELVAQFNPDFLKASGLDPAIAEYFRQAPRFFPGENIVQTTLNGNFLGRKSVRFDETGQLCFTTSFVRAIGLKPITDASGKPVDERAPNTCLQYSDFAPRTVVTLMPNMAAVDIVVPPEFVSIAPGTATEQGGTAGILNYRAFNVQSHFNDQTKSTYRQLDTTLGLNVNDWILRSQQSYSGASGASSNLSHWHWQNAFGQKTFADQRQVFQAGLIPTQNSLYGGISIAGAQWFPEQALTQQNQIAIPGIANSRARVEVTQNGIKLYSTVVPPGPFNVTGFPVANKSVDLQVKVIEENGSEQNFTVPASTLLMIAGNPVAEGLSVSAGVLWDEGDLDSLRKAPVFTASKGIKIGDQSSAVVGSLLSRQYASGAVGFSRQLGGPRQTFYTQAVASKDFFQAKNGVLGSAGLAFSPTDQLQYGISGNLRSQNYSSVQEAEQINAVTNTMPTDPVGARGQLGATASYNAGNLGGLSTSITRQSYFNGDPSYTYSMGWDFAILKANLSVGLARNAAHTLTTSAGGIPVASSSYLYANLSIPLGHNATSHSYVRQTKDFGGEVMRTGTGVSQHVNDYFGYQATVDSTSGADAKNTSLTAYAVPRYASVVLGASMSQGNSSYYTEASGGVIFHPTGIAFSPTSIQDTFGIAKLGNVAGIRLDTPQGPVWSGPYGLTAIPGLTPYHESLIEVSGKSLPDDVDIDNGSQIVQAGRGAVIKLPIGITLVRRVLLTVMTPDGSALPSGLPVLRTLGTAGPSGSASEFFTASASGGHVMLTDLKEDQTYFVMLASGKQCTFSDIKVDARLHGEHFERGSAHCA